MPSKMSKRQKLAPGEESSVTVSLKFVRDPSFHVTLPLQPVSTSVHDLKREISQKVNLSEDKLRLLYKKKPCPDMKMIKDLAAAGEREVEFSVMVMGGGGGSAAESTEGVREEGPTETKDVTATGDVVPEPETKLVLDSNEFWQDLQGFLSERLKHKGEGEKVAGLFKRAWTGHDAG